MKRLRLTALAVLAGLPCLLRPLHRDPEGVAEPPSLFSTDSSCAICHPGPTKGLRQTAHAFLLDDTLERGSCTPCHGDLREHARHAQQRDLEPLPPPPAVATAACAECHGDADLRPADAAHPWVPLRAATALAGPTPGDLEQLDLPALEDDGRFLGLQWSALVAAGYRFLDVDGSLDRYRTDINLDRGFRLVEAEVEGVGTGNGWADLVRLSASSIGDPHQRVEGLVEKSGLYRGRARFQRDKILYLASGDFHRVDKKSQQTSFDVSLEPVDGLEVFANFTRRAQDGFWLTNRIGNQNLTPLTTVDGVESPRQSDSDRSELGIAGTALDTAFSVSVEYLDDRTNNVWSYSQASPINPAFTESEVFRSTTSLRGPGSRFSLARSFEVVRLEASGRVLDLDRRVQGSGVATGFDVSDFVTTTESSSAGDALTWLVDLTATVELGERAALLADLRWLDHEENIGILQTDLTRYPTLSTQTSVVTDLDQRTRQKVFEGSVQFDVEPLESLTLTAGYGWSREQLRVPDLQAGDNDFVAGTIADDGILAGAQWRPDAHWTFEAGFRRYGQNGPQLHDIVRREGRGMNGKVRYRVESLWIETFFNSDQRENDLSNTRFESISTGVSVGLQCGDGVDLNGSYVFGDIDSRTLTNFYFDPDPNPQATFVGFDGATHTVTYGLGLRPDAITSWRFDGVYTETRGTFDVRLFDWRTDLSVRVFPGGSAGILVRSVDYQEAGGADDYDALMTLVYWRQSLGGAAPRGSL